jgi:anaerobic dimethyl sulfoxide reductase subunit B (iron-sulfur subunit)
MQLAFFFDQTRCIGCYTCAVACKDWHDIPAGTARWLRVKTIEQGRYPEPFLAYLVSACYHCNAPACVAACPMKAISKREQDGIVMIDNNKCLGRDACQLCLQVCPYGAPQFGVEENALMQKCDFCLERWLMGKRPVCVDSCPAKALDAGPLDEMRSRYGEVTKAAGFKYDDEVRPSIVFKPKLST